MPTTPALKPQPGDPQFTGSCIVCELLPGGRGSVAPATRHKPLDSSQCPECRADSWSRLAAGWLARPRSLPRGARVLALSLPEPLHSALAGLEPTGVVRAAAGDLRSGAFGQNAFDAVILGDDSSYEALDIAAAYDCFKALKPGGMLLIRPAHGEDAARRGAQLPDLGFTDVIVSLPRLGPGGTQPVEEPFLAAIKPPVDPTAAKEEQRVEAASRQLLFFCTQENRPVIRPAPLHRDWMELTPAKFAYRCLPLSIANCHAWEILCPVGLTATWSGASGDDAIKLELDDADAKVPAVSQFGSGILTFYVKGLFRTPPGVDLFLTGPINRVKRGIHALSAIIETDWTDMGFTMNWVMTRPGVPVKFEQGEPFCAFFPLNRGFVESFEPSFVPWSDAPGQRRAHRSTTLSRKNFGIDLMVEGSNAWDRQWQRTYFQGAGAPGNAEHRTRLKLKPFAG